jgi:hypothetical protein
VAVGPLEEDALLPEQLHLGEALGGSVERRLGIARGARVAGAGGTERAERQDAVVPIAPLDAEGIAADGLQPLDVCR